MSALQKTLAIIAFIVFSTQTVRHAYVLWFEPRTSVLDKYDRPLRAEITQAASLDELVKRYDPVRKAADQKGPEHRKGAPEVGGQFGDGDQEPFKSERQLKEAINEWESRAKEIRELKFYWFVGLGFLMMGALVYAKWNRWLGLTLTIGAFGEFVYWTSPTFLGAGTHEFDWLLVNKLGFSIVSWLLLLVVIQLQGVFAKESGGVTR